LLQYPHFAEIDKFLQNETETYDGQLDIYPPPNLIFNAFNFFEPNELSVVLLGQDPYINPGEAMGLAFSVPANKKVPPSLVNIYKELSTDIGSADVSGRTGDLSHWAQQGVLLLNTALTVRQKKSNSHQDIWKPMCDWIIKWISDNIPNVVYILWGNNAKDKKKLIDLNNNNYIVESAHPSPLSATKFFGSRPFSKTNEILVKKLGKKPIVW